MKLETIKEIYNKGLWYARRDLQKRLNLIIQEGIFIDTANTEKIFNAIVIIGFCIDERDVRYWVGEIMPCRK